MRNMHLTACKSLRADGSQEFTLNSKFKEDKVDQEVSASYKAAKYAIKASVSPAGKVRAVPAPLLLPHPKAAFSWSLQHASENRGC